MRRTAPVVLLSVLAACAPATPAPGIPAAGPEPMVMETSSGISYRLRNDDTGVTRPYAAPVDRVWAALPGVYEELGIPTGVNDPEARVFGNRRASVTRVGGERVSRFVRCGNEQGAGPSAGGGYRVQLSVLTTLRGDGAATQATTTVGGTATPVAGTSNDAVACVSTGALEKRIGDLIAARLGA